MERKIKKFSIYRHFKGKWYMVFDEVENTETGEVTIAYTALYGSGKSYNRNKQMFLSLTDKKKHPKATQPYRFMNLKELVEYYGHNTVSNMLKTEIVGKEFIEFISLFNEKL